MSDGSFRQDERRDQGVFTSTTPGDTATAARLVKPNDTMQTPQTRLYHDDASVLLLGFEGAGKKTLGIMASLALKRQLIEYNRFFAKETGLLPNQYIAVKGFANYTAIVPTIVESLLSSHSLNCVISGLPQSNLRSQRELIRSFTFTNPVIYIRRSKDELQVFSKNNQAQFKQLYDVLDTFYRCCSAFDYFNLSQLEHDSESQDNPSTLKLKDVETDFVRFVHRIFGTLPNLSYARSPFSSSYTYALQIPIERLDSELNVVELECGVDAIILVIAVSDISTKLHDRLVHHTAILRRKTKLPVFLELRCDAMDPARCITLLTHGLRVVPDAMFVDLLGNHKLVEAICSNKGSTKIIGTYRHTGTWKKLQEQEIFFQLQALIVKYAIHALQISVDARSRSENMECLEFAYAANRYSKIPLIAYNEGEVGRTSVCFNKTLSPVVLPSASETGVTAKQARAALYQSFVLDAKRFTILGSSVSYSLSPAMHNAAYEHCGLAHRYDVHQANDFHIVHDILLDESCGGVTISMPFKTQILPLLHLVSAEAQTIGAVNTVVVERQGRGSDARTVLKGYNTDYIGIRECITRQLSPANSIRRGTTGLILGAGGMARAAMYVFEMLGVRNICIYNRTKEHATKLMDNANCCTVHVLEDLTTPWPNGLEQPTMIVSTIPAHAINGAPAHSLDIPEQWLRSPSGGTFVELAYKPKVTRFIRQMRQTNGWVVVDGLSVLLEQGLAQFELFTGVPAPALIMRNALRKQHALAATDSDSE